MAKRLKGNEYKYVQEVLDSEFQTSTGANMMKRLEEAFAERYKVPYAISHINGTATMHTLLEAMGVGAGDEVIVPPLTMSSTSFVVLQCNATPVFADVDLDTFVIDPSSIKSRITERTKAIITVSLYGLSPEMDRIMEIAKEHNLYVIEDNAQCFLGKYKGQLVGTIGDAASYSFQSSKHLTSGEGGIVITNNQQLADNVRRISSLGYAGVGADKPKITKKDIQDPDYSRHVTLGWNYRIPELCAAVALAQVEQMDNLVQQRIQVAKLFAEIVENCSWLVPQRVGEDFEHTYWAYTVKLEHPNISWHQFRDAFLENGGDGIYAAWKLTYLEPMFEQLSFLNREKWITEDNKQKYRTGICPNAEYLQPRLLQFKTNYWDLDEAETQAQILSKTIKQLSNKFK